MQCLSDPLPKRGPGTKMRGIAFRLYCFFFVLLPCMRGANMSRGNAWGTLNVQKETRRRYVRGPGRRFLQGHYRVATPLVLAPLWRSL